MIIRLFGEISPQLLAEFTNPHQEREDAAALIEIVGQLTAARTALGVTQVELARRIGKDQAAISGIEKRKFNPRPKTLESIADALGRRLVIVCCSEITPSWLARKMGERAAWSSPQVEPIHCTDGKGSIPLPSS